MVFVKKQSALPKKDLTVAGLTGKRTKAGHVGLEVEVESPVGRSLPRDNLGNQWYYEQDGSLRGADNGEYILRRPINFDAVDGTLDELWACFKAVNAKLAVSDRTSIHVHLNVMPFFQNRLVALLALWYIFEEPLSYWCGEERVGNMFCLRAKDGPAILTQIREYVESKGAIKLPEQTHHYAALNVSQMWTHGSIEVRTLRGVTDPALIKQWVGILKKLYDLSTKYTDPRSIIEEFSLEGPMDFFRSVFREDAEAIYKECGMTDDEFRASLYEGVRYAQELTYARDWSDFKPEVVPEDPFGRKMKGTDPPALEPQWQNAARLQRDEPEGDLEEVLAAGQPRRGRNMTFANLARAATELPRGARVHIPNPHAEQRGQRINLQNGEFIQMGNNIVREWDNPFREGPEQ